MFYSASFTIMYQMHRLFTYLKLENYIRRSGSDEKGSGCGLFIGTVLTFDGWRKNMKFVGRFTLSSS